MDPEYFYVDINLKNLRIVKYGVSKTASLTGDTADQNIHRAYLTKGQFNKLKRKIKSV